MKQPFFQVVSNKSDKVGRINIYGVIGDYWEAANTARAFQREFTFLEERHDRIDVYINSPGGSVWDGLPIFNTIKNSKTEVHTYVIGIAFSMGFMLTIAAKKGNAHAYKGSMLMAHNVSTFDYGNAKKLRETADTMEKYDKVLGSLIADRSGKTEEEVAALWMDYIDHYFTPEEALEAGFIDAIEDKQADDMPENVQNLSYGQIAAYYNEKMEEPSQSTIDKIFNKISGMMPGNSQQQSDNMFGNKFPKMKALAQVAAASHTAEAINAANLEIAENEIEGVTLVLDSELETVNDRNTTLEANATKDATTIKDLEAKVKGLESEVAAYKAKEDKKPAAEAAAPVTDKNDAAPDGGDGREVDDAAAFRTSVDDEYEKMWAK